MWSEQNKGCKRTSRDGGEMMEASVLLHRWVDSTQPFEAVVVGLVVVIVVT